MSNKPLTKQDDATASAPKATHPFKLWIGGGLILFGLLAVVSGIQGLTDNVQKLIAPKGIVQVEVVSTAEDRQRGLSGRELLSSSEGMLFIFDEASLENCIWMKDMKFAIDIVWLDEEKRAVKIAESVSPDTYPESFCPETPAKYVVELTAGRASQLGIGDGVAVRF